MRLCRLLPSRASGLLLALALLALASACGPPPPPEAPSPSPTVARQSPPAAQADAEEEEEEEHPAPPELLAKVPPALRASGEAHPRQHLMDLSPVSALTTRYWVGDSQVFRLALLRALTDETNPLGLSKEEKAELEPLLRTLLEAQLEVWFRGNEIRKTVGPLWLTHEQVDSLHDHKVYVEVPEDNFDRVFPVAETILVARAGGETAQALPYEGQRPADGQWPERRDKDRDEGEEVLGPEDDPGPDQSQPIEDMAYLLAVQGGDLSPQAAAASLAELREIRRCVGAMRPAWMKLTVLGTKGDRGDHLKDLAGRLEGKDKPYKVIWEAWEYLGMDRQAD